MDIYDPRINTTFKSWDPATGEEWDNGPCGKCHPQGCLDDYNGYVVWQCNHGSWFVAQEEDEAPAGEHHFSDCPGHCAEHPLMTPDTVEIARRIRAAGPSRTTWGDIMHEEEQAFLAAETPAEKAARLVADSLRQGQWPQRGDLQAALREGRRRGPGSPVSRSRSRWWTLFAGAGGGTASPLRGARGAAAGSRPGSGYSTSRACHWSGASNRRHNPSRPRPVATRSVRRAPAERSPEVWAPSSNSLRNTNDSVPTVRARSRRSASLGLSSSVTALTSLGLAGSAQVS
jgi:hypothetical protein